MTAAGRWQVCGSLCRECQAWAAAQAWEFVPATGACPARPPVRAARCHPLQVHPRCQAEAAGQRLQHLEPRGNVACRVHRGSMGPVRKGPAAHPPPLSAWPADGHPLLCGPLSTSGADDSIRHRGKQPHGTTGADEAALAGVSHQMPLRGPTPWDGPPLAALPPTSRTHWRCPHTAACPGGRGAAGPHPTGRAGWWRRPETRHPCRCPVCVWGGGAPRSKKISAISIRIEQGKVACIS